jgi:hypothetical protein
VARAGRGAPPGRGRRCPRAAGLALVCLLAAGCGRATPTVSPGPTGSAPGEGGIPPAGQASHTDAAGGAAATAGDAPGGDRAGHPPPPELEGRLVVASVDDPAPRGVVDAFALPGGERTRLWDTGPETSAWRMAPDGRSVAYLAALREPTEIERLVVRSIEADAPEREAAASEATASRLAGFAWSADGRSIAAIRQVGFPGSAPAPEAPLGARALRCPGRPDGGRRGCRRRRGRGGHQRR